MKIRIWRPNRSFKRLALQWFRYVFLWERWRTFASINGETPRQVFMGRHDWHTDYCADPFLFRWADANWLFYETLDKNDKGVLGCFKEDHGKWIQQGRVLELPCHLSYPQIFEEDGHVYMIPESFDRGNGGVHLFEATNFPFGWVQRKTLFKGGYVDSTLLRQGGHYYLATDLIKEGEHAELWHSETLLGTWKRHPQNRPISNSPRLRRCAGSFRAEGGQLYRLAQDCNGAYGKRVYRVPVLEVSPTVYKEGSAELLLGREFAGRLLARHTYNTLNDNGRIIEVFDVRDYIMQNPIKILRNACEVMRRAASAVLRRI